MKTFRKYSMILASATLVSALAACGNETNDTDVPPGNSSNAIGDNQPAERSAVAGDIAQSPEGGAQQPNGQQGIAPNAPAAVSQDGARGASMQVSEADIVPEEYTRDGATPPARMAIATIQPTQGNDTSGMVAFIQQSEGEERVRVVGKLVGIPAGQHGFHIHEFGDCTAPDASSAGEHYNPDGTMHGGPETAVSHLGDFGNVVASTEGTAEFDFYSEKISLTANNSIINKAFVVHANADDLQTQPSGNSGDRIACGVVQNQDFNTTPELSGRGTR